MNSKLVLPMDNHAETSSDALRLTVSTRKINANPVKKVAPSVTKLPAAEFLAVTLAVTVSSQLKTVLLAKVTTSLSSWPMVPKLADLPVMRDSSTMLKPENALTVLLVAISAQMLQTVLNAMKDSCC